MVTRVSKAVVKELERIDPHEFAGIYKVRVSAIGTGVYPHYPKFEYTVYEGEEPKIGSYIKVTIEQDFYAVQ